MSGYKNRSTFNWQRLALILFTVVGVLFLWTEHRAQLLEILPYLILLLCPLIHIFMHKGHGQQYDYKGHRDVHHNSYEVRHDKINSE